VREVARIGAGLVIVVLLLVLVVRPLIKGLTPPPKPILVSTSAAMAQLPKPENSAATPAPLPPPMPGIPFELQLEQAKTIVSQDAPRVAQVLKEWVQNDV
jgi:flagellar M-ring protein FliF